MAERKPISKKKRFEVFKRDRFTCQYCGRMAPDVVLEVDHIKPVAEGGNNGLLNLITSCRDCNRGKGKTRLSDNSEVTKQKDRLLELAEKREQMEMILQWREELSEFEDRQAEAISDYLSSITDYGLSDNGLLSAKKYIKRFSFQEVIEAIDISFSKYYTGSERSWLYAWDKVGGVCYNRRKQREGES